jgi:HD-GYP domain-containing protein (c-di-GMP phosphodiesterase class II)
MSKKNVSRSYKHALEGRRKRRLAVISGVIAGALLLFAGFASNGFPEIGLFISLALAYAFFGFAAVQVNNGLTVASTSMVAVSAGVAFALSGGTASFALPLLMAIGPVQRLDVTERRVTNVFWNLGQLVVTGAAVGWLLDYLLADGGTAGRVVLVATLASTVYTAINLGLVYLIVRYVFSQSLPNIWSGMATLVPSVLMMGLFGGVLGFSFTAVEGIGFLLPLVMILFLVGHQAVSSYAELWGAYRATLVGFVKTLEAKDLYTRGHTERVAYFATLIGEELGVRGTRLEQLQWAALIHDLGKLVVPRKLIKKKGRLTDDEYVVMQQHAHTVEDILGEVDYLQPMVTIASAHHSWYDGGGYGGTGHEDGEAPSPEASILAIADAFDAMTSTRSYRVALSQRFAFEEMRRNAGTQFWPEGVEALDRVLTRLGERYGSPNVHDEDTARRLAETGSHEVKKEVAE